MDNLLTIPSTILGEDKAVQVFLPSHYHDPFNQPVHYPVVYVLDGEAYGQLAASVIHNMGQSGNMPEAIVVAINAGAERFRDYTPSPSNLNWQGKTVDWGSETGGAEPFLNFIEQELLPTLAAQYRTGKHRTAIGHSLGGLLVLHSFLTRPELFDAYLAIDASLWWDNKTLPIRAESLGDQTPLRGQLYCSLADHETKGPNEHRTMVSGYERFVSTLQKRQAQALDPDLDFTAQKYDDETHSSVVVPSLCDGLKKIFHGHRLRYGWATDIDAVAKHFEGYSTRMGYNAVPSETLLAYLAWQASQVQSEEAGMAFLQYRTEQYPKSSAAWCALAEGYEKFPAITDASRCFNKALVLQADNKPAQQGLVRLSRKASS